MVHLYQLRTQIPTLCTTHEVPRQCPVPLAATIKRDPYPRAEYCYRQCVTIDGAVAITKYKNGTLVS